MTVILKLGGSVITDKSDVETLDAEALDTAVTAIAHSDSTDLVLVHGAGSFGHHHADQYHVTRTDGTRNAHEAWTIHDSMRRLNDHVVSACHAMDLPALPVHPLSMGARTASGELDLPVTSVARMLTEDFLPVGHGDVLTHRAHGTTILSGDELVCHFAHELDADRVGFCTNVQGVLDQSGTPISRISEYEPIAASLDGSAGTDVTGGMATKVETLIDRGIQASIFSLADLDAFLAGETPGSLVDPGSD